MGSCSSGAFRGCAGPDSGYGGYRMPHIPKPVALCPDNPQHPHTSCRSRRSDGPACPTGDQPPQRPGAAPLASGGRRCAGIRRPGSGDSPMEPLHRGVGSGRARQDRAHARTLAGRGGRPHPAGRHHRPARDERPDPPHSRRTSPRRTVRRPAGQRGDAPGPRHPDRGRAPLGSPRTSAPSRPVAEPRRAPAQERTAVTRRFMCGLAVGPRRRARRSPGLVRASGADPSDTPSGGSPWEPGIRWVGNMAWRGPH